MKETSYMYGRHAVREALTNTPHIVKRLLVAHGDRGGDLADLATTHNIQVAAFDPKSPPRGVERDAVHQGIVAEINPDGLLQDYRDVIADIPVEPTTSIVVLGEVQDPHNVGAIIRSAAAFGARAVIMPEHRQAPLTATAIKASAGMAFRIPLLLVTNVNTTLRDLKERGFWVYGLEGSSETMLDKEEFTRASVFVVGNEGKGLREQTKKECDVLLSIPISDRCESLNASVSAAVVLYEWQRSVTTQQG